MKLRVLKVCIVLTGVFATYYLFFLSSIFYELYMPSDRFCGTAQVWALQSGAMVFTPTALFCAAGLWVVARVRLPFGAIFAKINIISRTVLLVCAFANLVVFLPLG